MRVLVAEDDAAMRRGIVQILEGEGYEVIQVADGEAALERYLELAPEFVVLDIMMPKKTGYDVCRDIRRRSATVPIILLSAKSEEIDKVLGLELGADDYVMKPFGVKEFAARIRAVARRALGARPSEAPAGFVMADLEVRPGELRARRGPETIDLSLREVKILTCLYENVGRAVDRERLFRAAWGTGMYPNTRTLDQHISKLRKKVEADPKAPRLIRTVHGVGYRFEG